MKNELCSKDFGQTRKVDWYWNKTDIKCATLETLYFRGELVINRKQGAIKYYSLAADILPSHLIDQADPNITEFDYKKWMILHRIGAVGMMWSRASDAWLGIGGWWSGTSSLKTAQRTEIFNKFQFENKICKIIVDEIAEPLYILSDDFQLLAEVVKGKCFQLRTELIASLDKLRINTKYLNKHARSLANAKFDYKFKHEGNSIKFYAN